MGRRRIWRGIAGAVLSVATLASLAVGGTAAVADEGAAAAGQSGVETQAGQTAEQRARQAERERNDKLQAQYDATHPQEAEADGARAVSPISYGAPTGPVWRDLSTEDWNASKNVMVPSVTVTVRGLSSGVEYCADLSSYTYDGIKYSDSNPHACAKASGSTAAFKIFLNNLYVSSDESSIRLYTHVTKRSDIVRGDGSEKLVASDQTIGTVVTVAKLADQISMSNIKVEDVGAQTVGLKYDYKLGTALQGKVSQLCLNTSVDRVYSADRVKDAEPGGYGWASGPIPYCGGDDVVHDDDTSADADAKREDLHKIRQGSLSGKVNGKDVKDAFTYTYQSWSRLNASDFAKDLDGKLSGTADGLTLTMLNPGTKYGNWGDGIYSVFADMAKKGETHRSDPTSSLRSFLQVRFADGSFMDGTGAGTYGDDLRWQNVPDFTTKTLSVKEPGASTPNSSGVEGSNGGVATAKSKYRLYIENLSKTCRDAADKGESMCSWAAYIYSEPKRLGTPDGQNALVRKDDQGRYYVDVNIPDGYQGSHKIALYTQDGDLRGWAPVRLPVARFVDVTSKTPHSADIAWLAKTAITEGWKNGNGDYEYRGMNTVIRQDMAAFLYRMAGSPKFDASTAKNPFKDVGANTPHAKEILWLASTGITQGYEDGTFGGMRDVVRQDMAAFLHRMGAGTSK